jgi:hypothetical protein
MTGQASLMDGQLRAQVALWAKRPMSMRMEMSLQGRIFIQAFDGTTAWVINPFMGSPDPVKSSEEDTKIARYDADFIEGSLVDYQAKGNAVEFAGKEDVDRSPAYNSRSLGKADRSRISIWC